MGSNRIRKQNTHAELEKLDEQVTSDLMAFNLTVQRIVDLCNEELELDVLEGRKAYSSFHRALDGHDSYVGIVNALKDLCYSQQTTPAKYLPKEGPGEDLAAWMAQFAKATWWYKLLKLDMTQSTLNSWFSGRGKRDRPDVREQVEAWWAKLSAASAMAERVTAAKDRDRNHKSESERTEWDALKPDAVSWDTWCRDLLEDGVPMNEVEERFIAEGMMLDSNQFGIDMIDLANPQSPVSETVENKYHRESRESMWKELLERDFGLAVSRTPPEFDPTPYHEEHQWGDRRNENCPVDLNAALYKLHYRTRYTRFWNADLRCVDADSEIVAVSRDGVTWREPTDRETQGWDRGFDEWLVAMDAFKNTNNLYTQELQAAEARVRGLERRLSSRWEHDKESLNDKLAEAREDAAFAYRNTG